MVDDGSIIDKKREKHTSGRYFMGKNSIFFQKKKHHLISMIDGFGNSK